MLPPVVMLHHVSDDLSHKSLKPYSISRQTFLNLLNYLEDNEYGTLTFVDTIKNKTTPPRKQNQVIITFDDCPKHLFDFAIPELQKRKMTACFYMPTAHIGKYNVWDANEGRTKLELMNEDELKLLADLGMEIGSHSHEHIKLRELPDDMIKFQIRESKMILESIIEKKIISFAYPFGSVPNNHSALLKATGYSYGLSIYQTIENSFALRRFIYHDEDTEKTIRQKLSYLYRIYRFITDPIKKY